MERDLEKIIKLDGRDIAASIAQDKGGLLDLWDSEGVVIPPNQDPVVGINQINDWLHQSGGSEYEVTCYGHMFEERTIIGEWAFEWGYYRSAASHRVGGQDIRASGKLLRILKRQPDGEWRVARAIWNSDRPEE